MAIVALTPVTLNPVVSKGSAQIFRTPVINDLSGAPVDLSAFDSINAKVQASPTSVVQNADGVGVCTGNADGTIDFKWRASDELSGGYGNARFIIYGENVSGDGFQTLATGILTLQQGPISP